MSLEIWTTACIECAHSNPQLGVPEIHGHSYWLQFFAESDAASPTPLGWLEDAASAIKAALDHRNLDNILPTSTMESISEFVVNNWQGPSLSRVIVRRESIGCGVEWRA